MTFVTIDVVARYFFNRPLAWVFEATEYFMLYIPFLGMAWLVRRDGHVRIDLLVNALTPRAQVKLDLVTSVAGALTCAIIAYYAYQSTVSHYARKVVTYGIYPIPKYFLIAGICIGFALTTIEFVRRAVRRWRDLSGDPAAITFGAPPPSI
jgi:TRAP-type C4-dicarboxylate transport system permease small subunit